MRFRYVIDVEVQRTEGKFATKDEVGEVIQEHLDDANPADIDGVGPDSATNYEVIDWTVTRQE